MPPETKNTEIIIQEDSKQSRLGDIFNVFSYIAAIAVGAFVADSQIRVSNYKQKRREGVFDKRHKARGDALKHHWAYDPKEYDLAVAQEYEKKAFEGISDADKARMSSAQKEKVLRDSYRNTVKEWYESRGMKTLKDFWVPLEQHDKIKVAVEAFTVGGIALGVLLTIGNTKSVSQFFTRHSPSQRPKTNVDRLVAQTTDQPATQGR